MTVAKISDLARQGDGVAEIGGRKCFVAGALTGETVDVEPDENGRAKLLRVVEPSPDRIVPVCPYAGTCGGCSLQHLSELAYRDFKLRRVRELFPSFQEFDEPFFAPVRSRRRITLGVCWNGKARFVGFNIEKSGRVCPVENCAAAVAEAARLIGPVRAFIASLRFPVRKGTGDVLIQITDTGADVLITLPFAPDDEARKAAADFGAANDVARVAWRQSEQSAAEPLAVFRTPVLRMGDFTVAVPAGAFLQPSREGQEVLQETVSAYVGKAKKVVDLFCGVGTFALSLLKKKRTLEAADLAPEAVAALTKASDGRIKAVVRNLFKTPFYPDELEKADAVVFDPPRAGAEAQSRQLAASGVPVVVAVSCNPQTFARDAKILTDGGYAMTRLKPVDQFVFTPHTEIVARFERR